VVARLVVANAVPVIALAGLGGEIVDGEGVRLAFHQPVLHGPCHGVQFTVPAANASPRWIRRMPRARPLASSTSISTAQHVAGPSAGSMRCGSLLRKRLSDPSVFMPMIES